MPPGQPFVRVCGAGIVLLAAVAGSISGCSNSPAGAAANEPRHSRLARQEQADVIARQNELFREHLAAGARESAAKDTRISELQNEVARLQGAYDALNAQYTQVVLRQPNLTRDALTRLRQFARTYGDLAVLDEEGSRLILRNDIAFQGGAVELTREAAAAAAGLAAVLNHPTLEDLDVIIVVHSDAKPLPGAAIEQKLRQEAWEISSRRSLTLGTALAAAGVAVDRLNTLGEGDREPVADNTNADGRAQNRRTEILLLPRGASHLERTPVAGAPAQPPAQTQLDWSVVE